MRFTVRLERYDMSILTTLFTHDDLKLVHEGIRKFIRLQGLIYDPTPQVWDNWLADEGDLKAALRSVADAFKATEPMVGKRKYVGIDYQAPKSVKTDLYSFLTTDSVGPSITLQKRNMPMYLLVVEPVIDLFAKLSHRQMIDSADAIIDDVCALIDNSTAYGTYDDGLVARHQVSEMMRIRREKRKEELASKSRRRKARDPMAELFASLGLDQHEDPNDDVF